METVKARAQENPLISIVVNILLPVMILHKGARYLSPQQVLIVALCFPLIYGIQDYFRRGHKNYVSLVGVINILLTGSLALLSLNGIWFAFKEAILPFVLGCLVLGSAFTKNPAAKMMFCNPTILKMDVIEAHLDALQKNEEFLRMLRRTTLWLSLSFFISAVANFTLGYHVFETIDPSLSHDQQLGVLNGQLAHMTWMAFGMVALPLMIFSGTLIYFFLKRLSKMIDVPVDDLMVG